MCGIAGIYLNDRSVKDVNNLYHRLEAMVHALDHRGPDDRGYYQGRRCLLGMTRLSIIDLKLGHQPMSDTTGRYHIVFNGEIYNHQELRSELKSMGCNLLTNCDTEVILYSYIHLKERFLEKAEGMFSIAIYDSLESKLFLARDRLGQKPLYYYADNDVLAFSSEIKSLLKSQIVPIEVDEQAYWDFLTYRYIPGSQTSINNVRKLKPGCYCYIKDDTVNVTQYWEIPKFTGDKAHNVQSTFNTLFAESVKKRLMSDVPVGVILSGGLDSSAVLYEASKHQKIDSYHVFFDHDEAYNELKYAQMMADFSGSSLKTVKMTPQGFISTLSNIAEITDEPLSDLASIPLSHVCHLAKQDVKVLLSGEGADEVLAGYGLNHIHLRLQLLKLMQKIPSVSAPAMATIKKIYGLQHNFFNELQSSVDSWAERNNFNITYQAAQLFKQSLRSDRIPTFMDSSRFLEEKYRSVSSQDQINKMLHVISSDWLVENVLMKSDKVSMHASVESRCPFLDHHLVEYVFNLPGKRKVGMFAGKLQSKILLRKYLSKSIPRDILKRKKLGFPVPAYLLNEKIYQDFVFDILHSNNCHYENYFDKKKMLLVYDQCINCQSGEGNLKHFLWSVVVYELWHRHLCK